MTTNVVTDEQLGAFARRQYELFHRLRKGVLPFNAVMYGLQRLIEGDFKNGTAPTSYTVSVDRSLSLVQMIESGKYSNHEAALESITEECFPVNRSGELKYEKELFLIGPSHDYITTTEWKAELEANGWELEEIPELLALGAQFPDLQRGYYIIALSSSWLDTEGLLSSPALYSAHEGERVVEADWIGPDPDGRLWDPGCSALVSRKRR